MSTGKAGQCFVTGVVFYNIQNLCYVYYKKTEKHPEQHNPSKYSSRTYGREEVLKKNYTHHTQQINTENK